MCGLGCVVPHEPPQVKRLCRGCQVRDACPENSAAMAPVAKEELKCSGKSVLRLSKMLTTIGRGL